MSRLRMAALGYRYEYNRANDEEIVARIWSDMRSKLKSPNEEQRRLFRVIAQFRAHLAMRPILSAWVFEVASLLTLPFFLAGCWLKGTDRREKLEPIPCDGMQLVFAERWKSNPEIFSIPNTLSDKNVLTQPLSAHRLSSTDVALILKLLVTAIGARTAFPFQLALKCAVDVSLVRAAVANRTPDFVLVYWEFSCSLSAVTQAMAQSGIETYNVMHGDKHYYAKHAFFEVARCYCWNQFYADLFRSEHVHAEYHLFTNPAFVLSPQEQAYIEANTPDGAGVAAPHLATLVNHRGDQELAALQFAEALNALAQTIPLTVRTHPFYAQEFSSIGPLLSPTVVIEAPGSKSARSFLLAHKIIIGTVSTLLLEAAHLGIHVVIISTPVTKDLENYHFLYTMENVSVCSLADLSQTIAAIDLQAPVGQTKPTTRETAP